MSNYSIFDILLGEGDRQRNLGAIIGKYRGGITNIDRGVGSSWSNTYTTGIGRYGSSWVKGELSTKTITVSFTLLGLTPIEASKFRHEFGKAIDTPYGPEKLQFNDEPNWYYMAVTSGNISLNEEIGTQTINGTFTMDVPDGLKHSTATKVLNKNTTNPTVGSIVTKSHATLANVNNEGSVTAWPTIRIKQTADNGFIGVVSPRSIMAFGVEDATLDGEKVDSGGYSSQILLDVKRGDQSTDTGWGRFVDGSDRYYVSPIQGTACVNGGKMVFYKPDGYPTSGGLSWDRKGTFVDGYVWQGGCASFMIPADEIGEVGAKNWRCDFNLKIWEDKYGQTGMYTIAMVDKDKKIIAAYDIQKWDTNGERTVVRFWTEAGQWQKEIAFGANNNEQGQPNPNVAFCSWKGDAYFAKEGSKITFSYNGAPYSWNIQTSEEKVCTEIVIFSGGYHKQNTSVGGFMHTLLLETIRFTKTNTRRLDLVPNRYPKGSVLTVDCYKGEIYLSPDGATIGELSQGQRVIGSDILSLEPGKTPLEFTTSTWCKSPPEVEIEWTEHSL